MQPEGEELEEEAGAGLVVQCDAVIVGSGAGAGPVSALLAEAGLKVVLLEKANFTPTQELSLTVSSVTACCALRPGLDCIWRAETFPSLCALCTAVNCIWRAETFGHQCLDHCMALPLSCCMHRVTLTASSSLCLDFFVCCPLPRLL